MRIVNLVAGGTHEGRVLQVLLEKLEAIRDELRSDKVFDAIGRLFDNVSLREYMIEALTDDGERRVLDRLESGLTGTRVREIEQADERVYGQGEGRLRGAPDVAPGAVPLASRALSMRAEAARYADPLQVRVPSWRGRHARCRDPAPTGPVT